MRTTAISTDTPDVIQMVQYRWFLERNERISVAQAIELRAVRSGGRLV